MDMLLQPYACFRTHPKNCFSSRRRVELESALDLESQEPDISRSEDGDDVSVRLLRPLTFYCPGLVGGKEKKKTKKTLCDACVTFDL